ncbi:MAG: 3-oxoacyl-ACP reductase family protein [bacterium]
MELAGKIALVTGGSRGIGRDICEALSVAGARVVCAATRAENAGDTVAAIRQKGGQAMAVGGRVENREEVGALFDRVEAEWEAVDILVNNAGIAEPKPILDMTEADYDRVMDVNAKSVFLCSQRAAKTMKDRKRGGAIVHIGSINGINAFPDRLSYGAAKAAVHQMTRVMAVEWAEYGIRVNCVAPGYIRTDLVADLADRGILDEQRLVARIPQRRLGKGSEVADAVVFLAGEKAAYFTGSVLVMDGGWVAYGYL